MFAIHERFNRPPVPALAAPSPAGRPGARLSIGEAALHERTALLVAPQDAGALQRALARLVASPELRRTLGQAARVHCETRFSVEQMLDRMEEVFRDALGKN